MNELLKGKTYAHDCPDCGETDTHVVEDNNVGQKTYRQLRECNGCAVLWVHEFTLDCEDCYNDAERQYEQSYGW